MNIEKYRKHMTAEMLMGPNSLRILEELLIKHSLTSSANASVLDLGCGKGLTSLAIANETGAKVYAKDLWISAEDNAKRFSEWGVGKQIIPVHEDANELHFDKGQFGALPPTSMRWRRPKTSASDASARPITVRMPRVWESPTKR